MPNVATSQLAKHADQQCSHLQTVLSVSGLGQREIPFLRATIQGLKSQMAKMEVAAKLGDAARMSQILAEEISLDELPWVVPGEEVPKVRP